MSIVIISDWAIEYKNNLFNRLWQKRTGPSRHGKGFVMKRNKITRRQFIRGTGAAMGALAFPSIIPSRALGKAGSIAPSNRIVMGAIGVGSMGTGDMVGLMRKEGVQMMAVCDVDKNHRDRAKNHCNNHYKNKDCQAYLDFRELLARSDIDAVCTALPDHWHGVICEAIAKAGKDIYGQKPLARTIKEGRAICNAVHKYGCVWQTGSWQRSVGHFHRACELVRNGRIGKILQVEVGLPTGRGTQNFKPIPVPANLDWDWWLGPAPWREYSNFGNGSCHWHWRWIMDYSGGQLTDWAGHHIDIAHWGIGADETGPVEIYNAKGDYPSDGLYNVPSSYKFNCKYANGITMTVANNQQTSRGMGAKWIGEKGWIHTNRGGLWASDPKILKEVIGPDEIQLYRSNDHYQNFIDCIRTRKQTITPVEYAHRSISVGLLGEIAMLTGRNLKWDPEKEQFLNDEGANRLLARPMRKPWSLT